MVGGEDREVGEGRRSKDGRVNKEGRWWVGKLDEVGWYVFNGKGNGEGAWTYSGGRRST